MPRILTLAMIDARLAAHRKCQEQEEAKRAAEVARLLRTHERRSRKATIRAILARLGK